MKTSEQIDSLVSALAKAKSEMASIPMTGRNPFFKNAANPEGSKYSTLNDLFTVANPALSKNGLLLTQCPYASEGRISVVTTLFHNSGQWMQNEGIPLRPDKDTPQGVASVITYSKRQEAFAILGLSGDHDDDGQSAEERLHKEDEKKKPNQQPPQQQQQIPLFDAKNVKHVDWLEKALNAKNAPNDASRKEILTAMDGKPFQQLDFILKAREANNG